MSSADLWAVVDREVGVPVTFFVDATREVVTNAPQILLARRARSAATTPDRRADAHRDDATARGRVGEVLTSHLGLPPSSISARDDGRLTVDLTSDAWLERCGLTDPARSHLEHAAEDLRRARPSVRLGGVTSAWGDAACETGLDALVWAALLSSSRSMPLTIAQRTDVLASRRDDNPLAHARRAHAAAVQAAGRAAGAPRPARSDPVLSASLRAAILLTSRAMHDGVRTRRSRPALLALDELASAMLAYLERTPVTRTDLLALGAARSIVHECLHAVRVASPVPY